MRLFLFLLLILLVCACHTEKQKDATAVALDFSEIILSGIEGLVPMDLSTQDSVQFNELLFLDQYKDAHGARIRLDFISKSNLLSQRSYDSLKVKNESNGDFWEVLRSLKPHKRILIQLTQPLVKKDTARFEYTWQFMEKGSGKSFIITCVKQDGEWVRSSTKWLLAF